MGKICEYDSNGKGLWSFEIKSPWSDIPLKNDNILVTTNTGIVSEINRQDRVVWEVNIKRNPEYKVNSPQVSYRLSNGNTIVNNWFNQWSRNAVFRSG